MVPDGPRLCRLGQLLAAGVLTVEVAASYQLEDAAAALAQVQRALTAGRSCWRRATLT